MEGLDALVQPYELSYNQNGGVNAITVDFTY